MVWNKLKTAYKFHSSASYLLNYKEVEMSDPKKNDGKKSEGRIGFGIESDQGGNSSSTGRGRLSAPNRPAPPKPEYNPNK